MNRSRRVVFVAFGVVILVAIAARVLFPIPYYQGMQRLSLWRAGVRSFEADGVRGLLRDECDPHDPEARGCVCVALIHGLGDDPTTWKKLLMAPKTRWQKPVKLFALDMPRNQRFVDGDSPEKYRVRVQAEEVAGGLQPLCPTWVVVGNSLGAWEAAWVALDAKLKVEKLVLIDGGGIRDATKSGSEELFAHPTLETMKEMVARLYFKPHPYTDQFLRTGAAMLERAHLGEIMKAQKDEDFTDGRLSSLRLPTMVVWGAGDRIIAPSVGREIQAQIPSSVWREIPECGHVPQKECPEPVIQAINDMIRAGAM